MRSRKSACLVSSEKGNEVSGEVSFVSQGSRSSLRQSTPLRVGFLDSILKAAGVLRLQHGVQDTVGFF